LVTARGIITLWVARMVMCSLYLTGDEEKQLPAKLQNAAEPGVTLHIGRTADPPLSARGRVPFKHVYIYPTILDGQGRIMSKSAGNGVDPLDIVELYGADALRFTLAGMATETQDVRVPVKAVKLPDGRSVNSSERFELGRNFCNKLWQAATG